MLETVGPSHTLCNTKKPQLRIPRSLWVVEVMEEMAGMEARVELGAMGATEVGVAMEV